MQTLFLNAQPDAAGPFAGVAIEQSLDRVLDYSIPPRLLAHLKVGQRVKVPLGRNNRPVKGFVVSIHPRSEHPQTKPLLGIDDERVLLTAPMLELARWMSRYYVTPLGTVIDSIIPSSVKKRTGLAYNAMVHAVVDRPRLQQVLETTRSPKRRAVLARLLQVPPEGSIELHRLAGEAGVTPATVRKLVSLGLIAITPQPDWTRLAEQNIPPVTLLEPDLPLNPDQQTAFDQLRPHLQKGGFSTHLLLGVTGSGKTEVFLQCIRLIIEQGRQAIVLVPEIALTPQTVRRFTARFARVAILHSGLSAGQRHRYWQQLAQGQADVVVGARSAIFAPVPKLGFIVVDEEHESSYKQDTAPRYHARDVAIKRAQIEEVPVLLASATPSLESYHRTLRAQSEKPHVADRIHHLLRLPRRVRGLALPRVELVDLSVANRTRKGIHLISPRLETLLRSTLDAGQQAILLLNRRGYSNFVYCPSCREPMQCKYCDATLTYHRSIGARVDRPTTQQALHAGQLHCHYCLSVQPLASVCPQCGKTLTLFGLGTQRVEEELHRKFPDMVFARVDSDSMHSTADYEKLLSRFAAGEVQVLLGTQMIAKGLDYPNVTLVGVISGDTALSLPDFRASERTFQLITQVAGRAGRGDAPGRVVLQTFLPDDPAIRFALQQDFEGFARQELVHRRDIGLPPFARLTRIILRDQDQQKLMRLGETLASQLIRTITQGQLPVQLKGPMPCAIGRIAGYFRQQIILQSPQATAIQRVLSAVREQGRLARSERIAVDVDPVSLL